MHKCLPLWIAISTGSHISLAALIASMFGIFWKFARIGERLSPYVSICCIVMAVVFRGGIVLMSRFRCCGLDGGVEGSYGAQMCKDICGDTIVGVLAGCHTNIE